MLLTDSLALGILDWALSKIHLTGRCCWLRGLFALPFIGLTFALGHVPGNVTIFSLTPMLTNVPIAGISGMNIFCDFAPLQYPTTASPNILKYKSYSAGVKAAAEIKFVICIIEYIKSLLPLLTGFYAIKSTPLFTHSSYLSVKNLAKSSGLPPAT